MTDRNKNSCWYNPLKPFLPDKITNRAFPSYWGEVSQKVFSEYIEKRIKEYCSHHQSKGSKETETVSFTYEPNTDFDDGCCNWYEFRNNGYANYLEDYSMGYDRYDYIPSTLPPEEKTQINYGPYTCPLFEE